VADSYPGHLADQNAFQELAEPYRRQLQVHCYRMLGSYHEAEDVVQETFLRAWRSRDRFEGRTSFRNWLYRIATNACLSTLSSHSRQHRVLPEGVTPPEVRGLPTGRPATDIPWLQPYPDVALPDLVDATPGPEARYELHESVQLAFVAAMQQLPPRQRAVLLLRDVLGWSAQESAELLGSSVASVNSALQRARASIEAHTPRADVVRAESDDADRDDLLRRYVTAWEASDIESLVALLREDAVLSMPPWPLWYRGRDAIRTFLQWGMREGRRFRLLPTRANGQPAFGQYIRRPEDASEDFEAHALIVLTLAGTALAELTIFVDTRVVSDFGLPAILPDA
jgi:RNA polymerase sigma-70 factor, ECF subfamily